ncbi:hypothetical protein T265_02558 [Opisthorchis viverrini]|uniref:Uncharacterized protein n=1 Tax=Opisthorchis viverrini TaxID=6198 RepID=A0A074ZVF0_OPIVI|nr:hypothetical protein T265_02558 [Opisthorchis viverrini]KER31106.1 hypothetical protein T265_02558 [Opisthorchis viverrini]
MPSHPSRASTYNTGNKAKKFDMNQIAAKFVFELHQLLNSGMFAVILWMRKPEFRSQRNNPEDIGD